MLNRLQVAPIRESPIAVRTSGYNDRCRRLLRPGDLAPSICPSSRHEGAATPEMSDVSHAEAPRQLILEHELLQGQLQRLLLLHTTDRWYLGDFLRHARWLTTLAAVRPGHLGLATHRDYLP